MKPNILVLLLFLLGNVHSKSASKKHKKNSIAKYGHLTTLIEELHSSKWEKDELPCFNQLVKILLNVQNSTLWATWIWDSMQTPVGHLYGSKNNYGNYDECLEFPWERVHRDLRTQYCLAHIHLADVDSELADVDLFGHVNSYLRSKTKNHLNFNTLAWGICAPVVCKAQSVTKLVGALFRQTHLGLAVDRPDISLSNCYVAGETDDTYDTGYYIIWSFVAFCIILTLLCTAYVNYKGLDSKFTGLVWFKAFDMPRNIQSLVKVTDDDIGPLFGIRVIACFSIAFFHIWVLAMNKGVSNSIYLDKDFERKGLTMILNLEVSVDTFLFMSGFLLINGLARNGFKTFNPLKVIVKRYFRLTFPIVLVLLLAFRGYQHVVTGPVRNDFFQKEIYKCNAHWWKNLLMIQNYIQPQNMCYPILWSIACDFHLTILGTIIAWVFASSKKTGLLIFLTTFIAATAMPAAFAYMNVELAVIPGDFRLLSNYIHFLLGNPLYTPSHFRGGSYLVGMAAGYLMTIYNPVNYRNILSKKFSILIFLALLIMGSEFFITCDTMIRHNGSALTLAMYMSLKRIIWAFMIASLVMVCEYGTLPVIPSFLSWSAWVPVSRLSYGVYLIHVTLMMYVINTNRSPLPYDLLNLVVHSLGVMLASTAISFLVWTFYEAPLANIVSLVLRNISKTQGTQKDENIHNFGDLKKIEALQVNDFEKPNKL